MRSFKGSSSHRSKNLDNATLAEITLPQMTRCTFCQRNKGINSFSKKQQNSLRTSMIIGKIKTLEQAQEANIRCSECSPSRRNELQCALCSRWKGLECFSKRQRTCGDDACCSDCINVKESSKPTPTKADMDEALDADAGSDGAGSEIGEGSFVTNEYADSILSGATTSAFGGMTIKDTASQASASSFHTALGSSAAASTTTGYLPPHLRKASQSTTIVSSAGSASPAPSVTSTPTHTNTSVPPRKHMTRAQSEFARVRAAPSNKVFQLDDGGGRQVSDTESSDDEDEGPLM